MSASPQLTDDQAPLNNLWYLAGLSRELKPGKLLRRMMFADPVVLGRRDDGGAFALRDICPHRAAPFSKGRVVSCKGETAVECPYHGWRFSTQTGACLEAPALSQTDPFDPSPIRVKNYTLHEQNGLIWLYHGDAEPACAPPTLGLAEGATPQLTTIVEAQGPFDEAVIGLIDPAHTPFVHRQWWWREGRAAKEKVKHFEPTALGFRMPAHPPSSNSLIYQMIGGAPTTEIEFRLPGLRIEKIRTKRRLIVGVTAMTPIAEGRTVIRHMIYWDWPLISILKPILARMSDNFLSQDGAILNAQAENFSLGRHRTLYAGEPDIPAQWYFSLKRSWATIDDPSKFENPLREATLHWRT